MQTSEMVEYIKSWISDYCKSMPKEPDALVIGISGGIDSSVTSTLCALTGKKTIVLSMPIKQIKEQHNLSLKHQEWLKNKFKNVESYLIDLDNVFNSFKISLNQFDNEHGLANSRSRLRMTALYQAAASNNGIVVGTGNKIEDFGVGFFTKYGDGGVDISPIADLMKSEVYDLGKKMKIIDSILNAKPTDGLWDDGRSDEDQLGISYDKLEWAMNYNSEEINKYQQEILDIYNKHRNTNLHKMKAIPVFKKK